MEERGAKEKKSMRIYEKYGFLYHLDERETLGYRVKKTRGRLRKIRTIILLVICASLLATIVSAILILLYLGGTIKFGINFSIFVVSAIVLVASTVTFVFTKLGIQIWETTIEEGEVRPKTRVWKK